MWLNLVFKSMKADVNQARLAAFVKRLLQSLTLHQPAFICGTLYMLGEVRPVGSPFFRALVLSLGCIPVNQCHSWFAYDDETIETWYARTNRQAEEGTSPTNGGQS